MPSVTRKLIAIVAACCLAVSVIAYVGSYLGMTMNGLLPLAAALHIGAFLFMVPMIVIEYPQVRERKYFWKKFSKDMPVWVAPTIKMLGLFFAFHFGLFQLQSHGASPQIENGEYVLNSHGHIMRLITQKEYLLLKGAEFRLFATGWIFFYFLSTTYWWFSRDSQHSVEIPSPPLGG